MRTTRGFTLLETLVIVAILPLIMIAIVDSVRFFYRANTSSIEQSFQIASARRGVEFLIKDIREASNADDGSHPIQNIGSTTLTFFSDTDKDASVERIHYELNETILTRHVLNATGTPPEYVGAGATSTVSDYVRNLEEMTPLFRYYDTDGLEVTDYDRIGDVRSITVNLVVNILPVRAPEEFTLRSSATLRNLRDE